MSPVGNGRQQMQEAADAAHGENHHLYRRQSTSQSGLKVVTVNVVASVDVQGDLLGVTTLSAGAGVPTVPAVPAFPSDLTVPAVPQQSSISMPQVPAYPYNTAATTESMQVQAMDVGSQAELPTPTSTTVSLASTALTTESASSLATSTATSPGSSNTTSSQTSSLTSALSLVYGSTSSGSPTSTKSSESVAPLSSLSSSLNSSLSTLTSSTTISTTITSLSVTASSPSSSTSTYQSSSFSPSSSSEPTAAASSTAGGAAVLPAGSAAPTSSSTAVAGAGSSDDNTEKIAAIAGGIVGGLAGLAVLLIIALIFLRWYKRKYRGNMLRLEESEAGHPPRAPPPAAAPMAERQGSVMLSPSTPSWLHRFSGASNLSAASSEMTPVQERGFQRISGRKLPSAFSEGMSSRDFEKSTLSGSSFYRDSQGAYGGPGAVAGRSGTGDDAARLDKETLMPSPARTPVVHHAGDEWSTPPKKEYDPSSTLSPPHSPLKERHSRGTLGRSHPSHDGSRGSRFTEDV